MIRNVLSHRHVSEGNARIHVYLKNVELTPNARLETIDPNVHAYPVIRETPMNDVGNTSVFLILIVIQN